MKKFVKMMVLGSLFIGGGAIGNRAGVAFENPQFSDAAGDPFSPTEKSALKKVLNAGEGFASETFAQPGRNSADNKYYIRFVTAVSGDISSISYTRSVDGLEDVTVQVETVYKAISVSGKIKYYDPSSEDLLSDEWDGIHYWACYTLGFNTVSYYQSDIRVKASIISDGNDLSKGIKEVSLTGLISKENGENYYEMVAGSGAKKAEVFANPDRWFLYYNSAPNEAAKGFVMDQKAYALFDGFGSGSKEWYLRYQPDLEVGTVYDLKIKLNVSSEAERIFLRVSSANDETAVLPLNQGINELTVPHRTVGDSSSTPLTLNLLTDELKSSAYLNGTFSFSVDEMKLEKSVKFGENEIDMNLGETRSISYTNSDGGAIELTSQDETVVKVNEDGTVTAVAEGEATLVIRTNGGKTDTCRITVTDRTLTLDKSSIVLDANEKSSVHSMQLTPNIEDVEWISGDVNVATVEDGLVVAKSKGATTITARSGSSSASCDVIVGDTTKANEGYNLVTGNSDCKHEVVISDPGIWYFYTSKKSIIAESAYNSGTVRITTSAAASSSDTPSFRIQPLYALGTKVRVRFDIELSGGITLDSFKIGNGTDKDCLSDLQSGQKSFETEIVVSGTNSFSIKCKYASAGTIVLSNISFTEIEN